MFRMYVVCVQGVQLDDCSAAAHHCECSDTYPVCPRCGGARQLRDPVGVASVGVASVGVAATGARRDHVAQAPPTRPGDSGACSEAPPTSAAASADDSYEEAEQDVVQCLRRLQSAPAETGAATRSHQQQQHVRSFSAASESSLSDFSSPISDVGGVSARSAPDSAFPLRQPEVSQGQEGQRSKFQRFFEPLKRSKSTGNHKDVIAAAQASLYDPASRQQTLVGYV